MKQSGRASFLKYRYVQIAQKVADVQKSVAKCATLWFKSYPHLKARKAPKIELYTNLFTLSTKNERFRSGGEEEKTNNCFVKIS